MSISKSLALLLLSAALSVTVQAQKKASHNAGIATPTTETKATKAETMDWIAGKMKENLAYPRVFVSYSNGILVYNKPLGGSDPTNVCTTTLDLSKITSVSNEYSEDFFISGKGHCLAICKGDARPTNYDYNSISGPNYNDYGTPFDFNTQQNLIERLRRAFATLVDYNSARQGTDEKF